MSIEKRISSLEDMIKKSMKPGAMQQEIKSLKRMIAQNDFSSSFDKRLKTLEKVIKDQSKMLEAMKSMPMEKNHKTIPIVIDIKQSGARVVPYPV